MGRSIESAIILAAVVAGLTGAAHAQQIEQAPLSAPPATGIGVLPPDQASPPQIAQTPAQNTQPLNTQDCVRLPTPVEQTDCLNQVSSDGNYMPTPAPAPGSQMPMEYRLPLGKRQVGSTP